MDHKPSLRMPLLRCATMTCFVAMLLAVSAAHGPAAAQTVVAIVNGDPITNVDIEQRAKLIELTAHKNAPRQEVLDELINDKVKIKEGKKFGVELNAADTDSAYASMGSRMRMSPEQLTKVLESKGIRPDTLKLRLKADTIWTSLVRGRFKESLLVGEKEAESAIVTTGKDPNDAQASDSFEYLLRPIVLLVPRGAESNAIEVRRKEAEALRNKIQTCDEAVDVFRTLRDAAIRDVISKTSADLPVPLREVLDKTAIGHLTAPEVTKQGVEMVALCSRKATTADAPARKEARDKLFVAKFEAKSKSYLVEARKSMMIEYPGK